MKKTIGVIAVVLLLSACGERPQTAGTGKPGSEPYKGTGTVFVQSGWKPGDKASWESHMKARGQYGQNDYTRMN